MIYICDGPVTQLMEKRYLVPVTYEFYTLHARPDPGDGHPSGWTASGLNVGRRKSR